MTQEDMKVFAQLFNNSQEKIIKLIDTKLNELEEKFDKKLNELEEKFDKKLNELEEKFDKKLNDLEERFDKKLTALEENMIKGQQELKEDIQRIRNNLFILENDYGKKIDALYDSREIELEKEREAIAARASINKRLDHLEIVQWKNEKRIASLEKGVRT